MFVASTIAGAGIALSAGAGIAAATTDSESS